MAENVTDRVMDRELRSGAFQRQASRFRDWIGPDPRPPAERGAAELPVEAGRYHLYVSLACPWCHRAAIMRVLAGLQDAVAIHYVAPFRDQRGWAFTGEDFEVDPGRDEDSWRGSYTDPLHGWDLMSVAYGLSDPAFEGRVTVPVLWDEHDGRIVNNESSEIIRMFYSRDSLGGLGPDGGLDLFPEDLAEEIEHVNGRVYESVNNGVYRAGFARRQDAYEEAFHELFASLAWLEETLAARPFLCGDRVTEADWRLFPTIARFDEVYHVHFRCNYRRIVEYPNLWAYTRQLYQWPGVAGTVAMDQIKVHYYTTHDELNPKHIVPLGPAPDWWEPHGRAEPIR